MFGECHAHIVMDGVNYKTAMARHEHGVDETVIHAHFEEYRKRHITFVRDGGDAYDVSHRAKAIAPAYGIDYRSPIFAIHKNGHYGGIVGRGFDTMAEYAKLVDAAACEGADFIKIMTTGIMDFDHYGTIMVGTPLEASEVREMVHIAHEQGFAVMSHTNGTGPVNDAIEAGVSSIEHGNFIDEETICALAQSRTAYVPTATVARNLIGCGDFDDAEVTRIWEKSADNIRLAYAHGAIIALGSDAGAVGVPHGEGLLDEYSCFKDAIVGTGTADAAALDARLAAGEAFIRDTFKRG